MDSVTDLVAQAKAAAAVDAPPPEDAQVVEKPLAPLAEYINDMAKACPEDVVEAGDYGVDTLVPGFEELSLGHCMAYSIKWSELGYLHHVKSSGEVYRPHLLLTMEGVHIIRGFSRQEWAIHQQQIIKLTAARMAVHVREESDERWIDADLQMCTEEEICIKGCVKPDYTAETIRFLPNGVVSHLAQAILRASGHDDRQLAPIPLK